MCDEVSAGMHGRTRYCCNTTTLPLVLVQALTRSRMHAGVNKAQPAGHSGCRGGSGNWTSADEH